MDVALDIITNKLIACEELWELDEVNKEIYRCPDCLTNLIPASFLRTNKKRPYFFYLESKPHSVKCSYNHINEIERKARKQSIKTDGGFPLPFPSKLILNDALIKETDAVPGISQSSIHNTVEDSFSEKTSLNHHRTVTTIKNIVRQFVNFPNDRDLPLLVPFTEPRNNTYSKVFKRVKDGINYNGYYIFYDRLYFSKPILNVNVLEIRLYTGIWEEKKQVKPCTLLINLSSITSRQRELILREIEVTRNEAIETSKFENNKRLLGYIFFLGKQDENNKQVFHTNSHRFISCITVPQSYFL